MKKLREGDFLTTIDPDRLKRVNSILRTKGLRYRDRLFILAVVKGMSAVAAYRFAGFRSITNITTYTRQKKVKDAVNKIMSIIAETAILSRDYLVKEIKKDIDEGDPSARSRALDMANKMTGQYQPEKTSDLPDMTIILNQKDNENKPTVVSE